MRKHNIILAVMLFFGVCRVFAFEGEAFGGGFFSGDGNEQQGGLGSMDETVNSSFMQATYILGEDFDTEAAADSPGPSGWYKLPDTDGGFKEGDTINFYGEMFILVRDDDVPYPYLVMASVDNPGNHLGETYPWFRMPVGNEMFCLLFLLLNYGIFRSFKKKKKVK